MTDDTPTRNVLLVWTSSRTAHKMWKPLRQGEWQAVCGQIGRVLIASKSLRMDVVRPCRKCFTGGKDQR